MFAKRLTMMQRTSDIAARHSILKLLAASSERAQKSKSHSTLAAEQLRQTFHFQTIAESVALDLPGVLDRTRC
jgi:hypothetical protein